MIYDILNDIEEILINTDSINEFNTDDDLIQALELDILEYYNLY